MNDPRLDGRISRRRFLIAGAAAGAGLFVVARDLTSAAALPQTPQTPQPNAAAKPLTTVTPVNGYPISTEVFTTRQRSVVPDPIPSDAETIYPYEIPRFKENGYGVWHFEPGVDSGKRLDIMAEDYTGESGTNATKLLSFFTMTDIHLADKESPAQGVYVGYQGGNSSGYSPVMLYTTHVLDAAIQTINAMHKQNPLDFGISLGDVVNNAQYNELRWFIDVLDGKVITPSSGNHAGADSFDYQKPYQAAGLDKTIRWYQTLGNHDHFGMGSYPITDELRQSYLGEEMLDMGNVFTDPRGFDAKGFYMGALDGRTRYGDPMGVGPVEDFASPPKVLAADPDRRPLTRLEWVSEFFSTTSSPVGHGFTQANLDNDFASYSFEPKSNTPIKVIVLDDTQKDEDFDVNAHGYLDEARYDWLVSELEAGQAEGKLIIIAAHIPIALIGLRPNSFVNEKTLVDKLNTYPNLMLWVAGHRHRNTVTARVSPDGAHPELGFWEVETASLRDFPQQFRTFDIVRNNDNTVSIFTTDVDPAVKAGTPAAISRTYSVAAQEIFKQPTPMPPTGSYNAELVKQLSPEMQAKISRLG